MMMMLRTKLKNKHKCCKVAICKETKLLIQQEEKNYTKVWLSKAHHIHMAHPTTRWGES